MPDAPAAGRSLPRTALQRAGRSTRFAGRRATAPWRPLPDFVIIGTQRGGTTSLYQWLAAHPQVTPSLKKEVHYFDGQYFRGERWYRAHFPLGHEGRVTGESDPYLLFHPLAPVRVAADLPATSKFIAVLREPTQRAISQYWHWRRQGDLETETLERAIELEPSRLAPERERFLRGERCHEYIAHSYVARGEYAPQLARWFDAVGRDRVLVVESERLFGDADASREIVEWLGLPAHAVPYPVVNGAPRLEEADPALVERLQAHFAPWNEQLFELLGRELWTGPPAGGPGHSW